MSSPFRAMLAFLLIVARLVRSPITVRAVTDLPEPDSPTSAMVSPLWSWKETSRTAFTMPPSTLKSTAIFWASRISSRPCVPISLRVAEVTVSAIATSVRINCVAQAIAKRIEGEDGDEDEDDGGKDPRIRANHEERACILQHQSP